MKGTVIRNLKLTKVVYGDTIKVLLDNQEESIRFICLDTEESQRGGSKPVKLRRTQVSCSSLLIPYHLLLLRESEDAV